MDVVLALIGVGLWLLCVFVYVSGLRIRIRREPESDIAVADPAGFARGDVVDVEGQRFEIR